ncbi:Ger(x)C family spore germination C-terminal domain-containing protein [Paradesulfitobacterium aromaticivorans]
MRKYPKEWKELKDHWKDKFSQVEVEVKVNSKIVRVGHSK